MDIDCYRLAYNTFYRNCLRFGIPEKDIPFAKTEEEAPLNLIIPGFSKAVVFFQIASRRELKTFFDESLRVHNLEDFYTRFENTMKKVFPERFIIIKDLPSGTSMEDFSEDAMKEESSEDTTETYLSEDNTEEDISESSKNESLSENNKKESVPENGKKKNLPEDSIEEILTEDDEKDDNKIKPEEVPGLLAFSLAICTELILYQYEDNKQYMENVLDIWMKYFNENLKHLCIEAGCTAEHLRVYSEGIRCPENFLNEFVTENKSEYYYIEDKFRDYIKANYAVESPDGCKFLPEVACYPKGLSFTKVKAQFRAILESCKCTKGVTTEEVPLLDDYSPCTPTSQ